MLPNGNQSTTGGCHLSVQLLDDRCNKYAIFVEPLGYYSLTSLTLNFLQLTNLLSISIHSVIHITYHAIKI